MPKAGDLAVFPVATHKFIVLSLCTFGLYEIYWGYQHWARIKHHTRESLSPFWRGLFGILWAIPLLKRIHKYTEDGGVRPGWNPTALGALFMFISLLWRLPDAWWLVSLASFVPLLPAVQTCQELNDRAGNPEPTDGRYTIANVLIILFGGLFLILAVIGSFLPTE